MSDLLLSIRTFIRLCEKPSFTRVAAEMHASHTTIARRLDQVEAHFGTILFHRTTRRLVPTPEADRLLPHARALVDALDIAEQELRPVPGDVSGTVRIGVTTALGLHYLGLIDDLLASHPGLRIDLAMTDWQRDLVQDRLDLALRVGPVADDMLVVHPLGTLPRLLVARPDYIARHGQPASAGDLGTHRCIAYGYGDMPAKWTIDGQERLINGPFRSDSSEAVHRAALAGLGIALLPAVRVADDLQAGRLVRVLPESHIDPLDILAVHPSLKRLPARARLILNFLKAHFPGSPPPR
ncbi:LysR family transcriptional regulator [Sphingobium sp. AP49]|uniref:LysR family transcriptional regulator n=1 Tax=Sphingobium sp. AP49 TaxID=1144307 RepID=UPI00026EE7BF|nr:LysR family transcriptional regulator [Sphingobium sp. AP49]WHO40696.1 LysR family transcriptional regulator [Sphingobium sp. AP49]